ncbi:putative 1-acyl-sn-glycerol-3-phosphate acyltransferase [Vanrija pseudolonga]|uniref:1-acyl-sn-glycerol-3-phosphate acyltransferase n=1 Tax=Vanrija pseudolonga TaxID=143232 RepID=A0AAF0Y3L6_9TREE|nr:putative 1-acyl-sn-glycerol-3-phosphate acyltransferase [Vanrija pseudolonga]
MPLSWVLKPIAIASAVAFGALGVLSRRYQRARFYFNLTIYVTTLASASFWGLLISIIATAAGQRYNINYLVARSFYHIAHPLMGLHFDVEGQEHLDGLLTARDGKPQSAVIIGNHQSMLDILYLGRIFPKRTSIMAKKELKMTPILGQYMTLSGAVFIDRKNRKDAVNTVEQAGATMKKNDVSIWIFPEGTRSLHPEPTMLPFKKGAFHLAVQAQIPVVPVVCENYHRLFDSKSRLDGGRLKIKILPPISTKGLTADDVHALAESTQKLMLETLIEISAPAPSPAPKALRAADSSTAKTTSSQLIVDGDNKLRSRSASDTPATSSIAASTESLTTEDEMDDDAVLLKRPKAE